jgi:hypothetical protein
MVTPSFARKSHCCLPADTRGVQAKDIVSAHGFIRPTSSEKFRQSFDAIANLEAPKKISSNWEQGNFIENGGWATRPGATSADYALARAAEKLVQAKSAAQ